MKDSTTTPGAAASPDIEALYRQLHAGDATARESLIVAAMPLVKAVVSAFVVRNFDSRYCRDDLTSVGYEALCKVVDSPKAARCFKAVVTTAVRNACKAFSIDYLNQSIKARGTFKRLKAGKRVAKHHVATYHDKMHRPPADAAGATLQDILDVCHSVEERAIVTLRSYQLKDDEIAAKLGLGKTAVFNSRKAIEQRFNELSLAT